MNEAMERRRASLQRLGRSRAQAVDLTGMSLIRESALPPAPAAGGNATPAAAVPLPLVIEPAERGVDHAAWARTHREPIEERLLRHGALLFRGFELDSVAAFEAAATLAGNRRERSLLRRRAAAAAKACACLSRP